MSDGWSIRVVQDELVAGYRHLETRQPRVQYGDVARRDVAAPGGNIDLTRVDICEPEEGQHRLTVKERFCPTRAATPQRTEDVRRAVRHAVQPIGDVLQATTRRELRELGSTTFDGRYPAVTPELRGPPKVTARAYSRPFGHEKGETNVLNHQEGRSFRRPRKARFVGH